jgi:hypothetical protein
MNTERKSNKGHYFNPQNWITLYTRRASESL